VNGSGDWIYSVPPGTSQNRQLDTVTGFLALSGRFWLETVSFPTVFAGNSRNTASGIIVLGINLLYLKITNLNYPISLEKKSIYYFCFV
jgi:hypothetical protein